MRRKFAVLFAALLALGYAAPARADITAFIGANTTPANRTVRGGAVGLGLVIVGLELEYANTRLDERVPAPELKTGMGNLYLQTPVPILGFQPYLTTGAGLFREKDATHSKMGLGSNMGGGVKIKLAGPIRLRVDYRNFRLGRGVLATPTHRVYAGLSLSF